ncbi:MAG: CPBP family intramembrane metalloprotease [Cyanobacteria bacterium]|nr:CPBP family intramembrane metalloprotease [Cyanobacteriota bacterium]
MTRKPATAVSGSELTITVAIAKVVLYLLTMVPLMMGVSQLLGRFGSGIVEASGIYANSLGEFCGLLVALLALAIIERRNTTRFLKDVAHIDAKALKQTAIGFVIGSVLVSIMFGAMYVFGAYKVVRTIWPVDLLPSLVFFLLVGICEELIFRGYIFTVIEKGCGTTAGVLVSSLIFGFAHCINPIESLSPLQYFYSCSLLSFEAGLPLVAGYILTRRIWLSVGMHWAWDFMEGTVFGFIVSGADLGQSILTSRGTGDFFLSGGAFGPEASIIAFLIGTIGGAVVLVWTYKNGNWRPFSRNAGEKIEQQRQ